MSSRFKDGITDMVAYTCASGSLGNTGLPLPKTLGSTNVVICGVVLPALFVSENQVNVFIPFELAVNAPHQLFVRQRRIGLRFSRRSQFRFLNLKNPDAVAAKRRGFHPPRGSFRFSEPLAAGERAFVGVPARVPLGTS